MAEQLTAAVRIIVGIVAVVALGACASPTGSSGGDLYECSYDGVTGKGVSSNDPACPPSSEPNTEDGSPPDETEPAGR